MDIRIVSLLFVVVSFAVLFIWVYLPSNRDRLEQQARVALDDEGERE